MFYTFEMFINLKISNCICLQTGDLLNEDELLQWLIEQKNTATIEEVTDEMLDDLIEEYEYVVVYFSKY